MSLASIALTSVEEVLAFLGENAKRNALWVYYAGATDPSTLEVKDDRLTLTPGGDILFSTYDTLTKLVAQIITIADWKAGLIYHGSAESDDLIVTGALNTLGDENEQVLMIQDNYLIERLIDRASDLINRYCNRTLKTTAYLLERYNGEGAKLFLENYPVTDIVQICDGIINAIRVKCTDDTAYNAYVEVDQSAGTLKLIRDGTEDALFDLTNANYDTLGELATAINGEANWEGEIANSDHSSYPSSQIFTKYNYYCKNQSIYLEIPNKPLDNYDVNYDAGIVSLSSEFSKGFQNIYVSYTAGYTSPIPYVLEQACIELVGYKYGQSKRAGSEELQSESFGEGADYKYTKFNLADIKNILPASLLAELDLFKKREF